MADAERARALQVLHTVLCGEQGRVAVWLLDEESDCKPSCRQWLRKGSCAYGDRCRHAHGMSLAEFGLRATRGASMPHIIEAEAKSVCYGAPGPPIAFILLDNHAVYDYEDPGVAKRFLDADATSLSAPGQTSSGNGALAGLTSDIASRVLLDSGMLAACRATAACHEWRYSEAAKCLREEIYMQITGAKLPGCTAKQLADIAVSSQLLAAVTSKTASGQSRLGRMAGQSSKCATSSAISPGECIALLIDAGTAFCVFRTGELRCYRVDTGQLLGSCQARRLGKGTSIQCACLLAGEALVLGDTAGGLAVIMRDDLSEAKLLRQSAPAAVASLAPVGAKGALAARADGCLELFSMHSQTNGIAALCTLEASPMAPAVAVFGGHALLCGTPDCVWRLECSMSDDNGTRRSPVQSRSDVTDAEREVAEKLQDDAGFTSPGCSITVVEQINFAVTACSTSPSLRWWSLETSENGVIRFEQRTDATAAVAGVTALASASGLVLSCHADGSLLQWHGTSRACIMHLPSKVAGFCILAVSGESMALAHATAGTGARGGKQSFLQFAAPAQEEAAEAPERKESKKEKPAKMFAHKSRGGKKNFESKQTGRHTALSK
eukprot:TRINITY_DN74826_c0_g1_i1.p1 TRINITY_DN74826_c0_g1~~TRINITY_DN74826_c0_g1_i1.p1  ORF type:complete len:609 (-),score=116.55 TRINITY_DN74826_c0_g1_i1:19-1845(-)